MSKEWTPQHLRLQLRRATVDGTVEHVLASLDYLDDGAKAVIRMYAAGTPWKRICRDLGKSRATADRHLRYLLTVISWNLNGRLIPSRWSRRHLLCRQRELSSIELSGHAECVRHLGVGQLGRAVRSIDIEGRTEHEDASTARRHGEPADSEDAAEDRGP